MGANEVFTAGDFLVTVISAQGSNGIYTGTGYIVVPCLADTKVKVSFNNIMLNTDKKLIEGAIETTYDPNETAVSYASNGNGMNDGGNNGNNGGNNNGDTGGNNGSGNNGDDNGNNDGGNNSGDNGGNNNGDNNGGNNNGDTGNDGGNNNGDNNGNGGNNGDNNGNGNSNGGNNNTETTYAIKYKNKSYKDGEILKFNYSRNLTEVPLEMTGGIGDYKVNWDFLKLNNEIMTGSESFAKKQNFNLAKYGADKFKIVATAFELDKKPKVSITINIDEKKFESSQLTATDVNNSKRIAKANETLYYLNKPTASTETKKTDFKLTVSNSLTINDIKPENLKWKIDGTLDDDQEGKLNYTLPIKEKDDKTVISLAGSPIQSSKTVNVKWVTGYDGNTDLFQKFNKVITFLQKFNEINKKFGKVTGRSHLNFKD